MDDDDKKITQTNADTNADTDEYQKILDEYAASVKPEDKEEFSQEPSVNNDTEEISELKDINPPQITAPDNKMITPNADISLQKPSTLTIPEQKPEITVPATPIETEEDKKLPPVENPIKENEPVEPETQQSPADIKAKIDEILADDSNNNTNTTPSTSKPVSFKNIFIVSLLIFLLVAAGWFYFLFFYKSTSNSSSSATPTSTITPTEAVSSEVCELNNETYSVGDSFKSADGCNTCTCQTGNTITCTEMACNISPTTIPATKSATTKVTATPTKPATTSSVPKDWKTYTNPTYKYSISYSPEWTIKTYPEHKNIVSFQSTEETGDTCGNYQITYYKSFTEISSLSSWLKTSLFKNFSQNTINGFTSYSVTQLGLSETKEFYIQNKDLSFCQITFCGDRDLTSVEKQFLNSFKFN